MSVVSGITLICSVVESGYGDAEDLLLWLNSFNQKFLFTEVAKTYGGSKHPQHFTFGAGVNYCNEDQVAHYILSRDWQYPENVVLIIQPEDGNTRVWSALHYPLGDIPTLNP